MMTLSKSGKELLDYLHAEADKEINLNLINLVTYGERLGWDRIEGRVLSSFWISSGPQRKTLPAVASSMSIYY